MEKRWVGVRGVYQGSVCDKSPDLTPPIPSGCQSLSGLSFCCKLYLTLRAVLNLVNC